MTNERETRLSIEQYLRLQDDPRYRDELVRGRLVREPRPKHRHGWIVMRLGYYLVQHVEESGSGYVMTESGFILEEDPPTVRGPDVSYVDARRVPDFPLDDYLRGAPDLAVEVLSPSDRAGAMRDRVRQYLAAGARLVWVVNPATQAVTVHRAGVASHTLGTNDVLDGADVLPGFRLPLARLFA